MEGGIFQIMREMTEMTGKNCQFTKRGGWNKRRGWNIFMKSINLETLRIPKWKLAEPDGLVTGYPV